MTAPRTLYITANSPGEISGFLRPVVRAARRVLPDVRVCVVLLPCTFATGRELEVAASIPGVDRVLPTRSLWKAILGGPPEPPVALLHLGGDLLYGALMAWRWKVPAIAYQWAQRKWDRFFDGYCVKTEQDAERLRRQGIAPSHIHVVGDLVVDAVRCSVEGTPIVDAFPADPEHPHVVFMPGSRLVEIRLLAPFLLQVAEQVVASRPGTRFSMLASPYLDRRRLREAVQMPPGPGVEGAQGTLGTGEDEWTLVSAQGTRVRIVVEETLRTLATADVVVSLPGTKTGEAGALEKPTLVIVPYNRPDLVPWFGALGLLDWVPVIGPRLKGLLLWLMMRHRLGLVAQPNILAGSEIVPELKQVLTPGDVSRRVLDFFDEPKGALRLRKELRDLYQPFEGAAERVMTVVAARVANPSAP